MDHVFVRHCKLFGIWVKNVILDTEYAQLVTL